MALNIKNAEVESLAAEVAKLAHESKTEAIRIALKERAFEVVSRKADAQRAHRCCFGAHLETVSECRLRTPTHQRRRRAHSWLRAGWSLVVLDSSAVVAIVLKEAGYQDLLAKIEAAPGVAIGAPTLVETLIVLTARLRGESLLVLKELLLAAEAEVIPFLEDHSRAALRAHVRFGKGRHRAALNFGDCLSYATASVARQPLLFVGDDFSRTDIVAA